MEVGYNIVCVVKDNVDRRVREDNSCQSPYSKEEDEA